MDQVSTLCASQSMRKERWNFFILKIGKKNEEIKGRMCRRNLVLFHIKQQMIHNTCTKLQSPICNSSWEIFVTNFHNYVLHWSERWKLEKWKKKTKINHRILVFFLTIYLAPLKVYTKFEEYNGCNRSWEFCDKKFYWRERKLDK